MKPQIPKPNPKTKCPTKSQKIWSLIGFFRNTRYPILNTRYLSKGFTLVEVLIASAVLIIAVTGTLSIIARSVSSAAIAQERVTAFYLAQEAIEYVRGVRDNNAINGNSWLNGLDSSPDCFSPNGCTIDVNVPSSQQVQECGQPLDEETNSNCLPLYLDENGVYTQDDIGNTKTIFTREVRLEIIGSDKEIRVDVTVKWLQGLVLREFTISGHIFNWR